MNKNEILTLLTKNLKETVPDIEVETIDPAQSMADLGANSLDIVEVVSNTMRELKVKIPREALSEMKNVGDLVDALHAQVQA